MGTRLALSLLVLVTVVPLKATRGAQPDSSPAAATEAGQSTAEQEIRKASASFAVAFDLGDAAAVAACWAPEGEYVDEAGQRFVGRPAIAKEYADFFAAHPGVTIQIKIDSLRLIGDAVAMEDGQCTLDPLPSGPPARSRYTAVHVKAGGEWLLASVRDTRVVSASTYHHLKDFEWLIGSWTAIEQGDWDVGNTAEIDCQWGANKSSVELTYRLRYGGGDENASGRQIIAWDPETRRIQSWAFASDGSRAIGIWTPREGGWNVATASLSIDGTKTSFLSAFVRIDANSMVWKSSRPISGETPLPDTNEVILERVPDTE